MRWSAAGACAAVLAAGACAPAGTAGAPLPPPPAEVEVRMLDHRFEFDRTVPGGQVVFRVVNAGHEDHEIDVAVLPEDFPPLHEQLRSDAGVVVRTLARFPAHRPGTGGTFALHLLPGRYAMVCFLKSADGSLHASKGMATEIRIA